MGPGGRSSGLPVGNMTPMSDYRAPVQDALFTLRHVGMLDELSKTERFAHVDDETATSVLEEYGRFMQEVFGPTNAIGDRTGLTWSPEGVEVPEELGRAYAKFVEAGWQGLNAEEAYGGAGFPGRGRMGATTIPSGRPAGGDPAAGALTGRPGSTS